MPPTTLYANHTWPSYCPAYSRNHHPYNDLSSTLNPGWQPVAGFFSPIAAGKTGRHYPILISEAIISEDGR